MSQLNQNQKSVKAVVPENATMMQNAAMWVEDGVLHIVVPDLKKKCTPANQVGRS